jgi:hypothetical protein
MTERHTITLNNEAFNNLRKVGCFGETYSQLILRLARNIQALGLKGENNK